MEDFDNRIAVLLTQKSTDNTCFKMIDAGYSLEQETSRDNCTIGTVELSSLRRRVMEDRQDLFNMDSTYIKNEIAYGSSDSKDDILLIALEEKDSIIEGLQKEIELLHLQLSGLGEEIKLLRRDNTRLECTQKEYMKWLESVNDE